MALNGGAGEVEGELALDVVEGDVGLERVDTLVRLVDDKDVPFELSHVSELVVLAAELDGALEVLQAHELDEALRAAAAQGSLGTPRATGRKVFPAARSRC